MVEPVATLLIGRGHVVVRAREASLDAEEDGVIADYADMANLVIVTFDPDFKRAIRRRGGRCLHIRTPERTARERLATHYREVIRFFAAGARLVSLPADGAPKRER